MSQDNPTYDRSLFGTILLRTLGAFILMCRREGLRYYLSFGSAIGAVRHGGLIPWDDDVDVCMPREDYERFLSMGEYHTVSVDGRDEKYRTVSLRTCGPGSDVPFSYAKWTDCGSTIWEQRRYECTFGVFVDVFPLDRVSSLGDAESLCREYRALILRYKRSFRTHAREDWKEALRRGRLHDLGAWTVDTLLLRPRRDRCREEFISFDRSLGQRDMDLPYRTVLDTPYGMDKVMCPAGWYGGGVPMPFGGMDTLLPSGYEEVLSRIYGDYMTPPPPEARVSVHHHYFVDLTRCLTPAQARERMEEAGSGERTKSR